MPLLFEQSGIEVWIFLEDEPQESPKPVHFFDKDLNEIALDLDTFQVLKMEDAATGRFFNQAMDILGWNHAWLVKKWHELNPGG